MMKQLFYILMALSQISILVLLVLSTIYTSESRSVYTPNVQNYPPTRDRDCYCMGSSGQNNIKVPEIIQPSQGLERLVVYLYRDVNKDQIKMYTPNLEKQKLLPDLPYENGDLLTPVSSETIHTLVNRSPLKTYIPVSRNVALNEREASPAEDMDSYFDTPVDDEDDQESNWEPNNELGMNYMPSIEPRGSDYEYEYNNPYNHDINQMGEQQYWDDVPAYQKVIHQTVSPAPLAPQRGQGQFSKWILEQMGRLNNYENQGQQKIDLSAIGNYILKILSQNGMYVTDEGVLTDSYGSVLDIQNLSLMPILVGNTMPLQKLIQRNEGELSSQMQTPYLQAILVTATHPLKILGVMPLGQTYLPLSTLNTLNKHLTNIWDPKPNFWDGKQSLLQNPDILKNSDIYEVGKSGSDDEDIGLDGQSKSKSKKSKSKKGKGKKNKDNGEEERQAYHPSNGMNVNGYENAIGRSDEALSKFSSRRGLLPSEDISDDHYSKRLNELDSIDQDVTHSNVGRIYLPNLSLYEQPLNIFSRGQEIPDIIVKSSYPPERINLPNMLSNVDFSLRRKKIPINKVNDVQNVISRETRRLRLSRNKGIPISGVVGKDSDPIKTLKRLSLIDIPSRGKDLSLPVELERRQINSINKYRIPVPQWPRRDNTPISSLLRKRGYNTKKSRVPNIFVSPRIKAVPVSAVPNQVLSSRDDLKGYIDLLDKKTDSRGKYQNIQDLFSLGEKSDSASRSGTNTPDIPEQPGTVSDGDQVSDYLMGSEGDDDDDGDFRIIGGNAATGSGTPLSNKGRSGYVY